MEQYDIIIIGGGASGLATAIMAKTEEKKILVIEHNDRVGKKILSTGNGKCNLTNLHCWVETYGMAAGYASFAENPEGIRPYYSSGSPEFAKTVIRNFNAGDTLDFFWDLGMIPLDKNGYVYPRSEQASAVLDLLRFRAEELGVEFLLGYQPVKVKKTQTGFVIDDEFACRKLVLATGGQNASKTGSDGSGYEIAKRLGHRLIKPVPALCALKCEEPFFKELKGVRTDAELSLFVEDEEEDAKEGCPRKGTPEKKKPLMTVSGNLQLNETGISGIPTFQLSLLASRLLAEGKKLKIRINFLPELTKDELKEHLEGKKGDPLLGVLHKKLAHVIEKESRKHCRGGKETSLIRLIREFRVHPVKTASFEEAQTTLGGISTDEINPETMESKLVEGLYFTGEIVDVSGICGGYNLQWAWSTAHAAAKAL